ncbi:NUDIX domain-containing protein [Candidatus Saccharibacteria bacterium]|nr:NUDIX domain-containing protein [Candidatus Saccharibacteria bacterium]
MTQVHSPGEGKITTVDVFGERHIADLKKLKLNVHVYGIAVQDGKILIVPQYDGYDFPGGTLELGETHIDTLKREFKEETGLDIKPLKLLGVYSSFFHYLGLNRERDFDSQSLLIFYSVKVTGGKISTDGFDAGERLYARQAEWLTPREIAKMHHACSANISKELLAFARDMISDSAK